MNWWRAHHGIATDAKYAVVLRHIASHCVTNGHTVTRAEILAVWVWMIDFSSQNQQRGSTDGIDPAQIAVTLDLPDLVVEVIISSFEKFGMVSAKLLKAWDKRQPEREDNSTLRTREYRDRKKLDVTHGDADVTHGDAVTPSRGRGRDLLSSNLSVGSSVLDNRRNTHTTVRATASDLNELVSQRFDEFWAIYPLKVSKDQACVQFVSVVTTENESDVFACLARYLASDQVSRSVVSKPHFWLRDQCRDKWKSEWPAAVNGKNGNHRKSDTPDRCPVCEIKPCVCYERHLEKEAKLAPR